MNRVLCLVANDAYVPGLVALIWSLKKHTPSDFDLRIISGTEMCTLSQPGRDQVRALHPDTEFVDVDAAPYISQAKRSRLPGRLYPCLLLFEAFRVRGYERLVVMGTDVLAVDDMSELFEASGPILFTTLGDEVTEWRTQGQHGPQTGPLGEMGRFKKTKMEYGPDELHPLVCSSPFSCGPEYMVDGIPEALLELVVHPDCDVEPYGDDVVMNYYFQDKPIRLLPDRYNVYKRLLADKQGLVRGGTWEERYARANPAVLHYAGEKPWMKRGDRGHKKVSSIWHSYYNEALKHIQRTT